MLLGLSSLHDGDEADESFDITTVGGSENGDGGVANGALLTRFAEEVHKGEAAGAGLDEARAEVLEALGPAGLVDAAAICANFNMMVRIADGTGTPLDDGTAKVSTDVRTTLDLDRLTSRRLVEVD